MGNLCTAASWSTSQHGLVIGSPKPPHQEAQLKAARCPGKLPSSFVSQVCYRHAIPVSRADQSNQSNIWMDYSSVELVMSPEQ